MDPIERALILRARERDVAAFSALVEKRWDYFVRFARSVTAHCDAEDAVQDGLMILWKKLPGLREPEAFTAWSLRIIVRLCIRRARRRRVLPLSEAAAAADARSAAWIEGIDVEAVLSTLPPRQRAVMHLTVIEGMTDTQIASAIGITAASVRSHRRRARETLSRILPPPAAKGRIVS